MNPVGNTLDDLLARVSARKGTPATATAPRSLVRGVDKEGCVVATLDAPCSACGDTSSVFETRGDGYTVAVPCPTCSRLRRAAEAITAARVPRRYIHATLVGEGTDWERLAAAIKPPAGVPAWTAATLREYIAAYVRAWEPGAPGIGLTGDNWCGKTHMAAVIAFGLASRGIRVRWWDLPGLFGHLRSCIGRDRGPSDELAHLARIPVLILDDLGAGDSGSQWAGSVYEDLIQGRLGRDPQTTIVTTNLAGEGLDAVIGSRAMARLMDQTEWHWLARK